MGGGGGYNVMWEMEEEKGNESDTVEKRSDSPSPSCSSSLSHEAINTRRSDRQQLYAEQKAASENERVTGLLRKGATSEKKYFWVIKFLRST